MGETNIGESQSLETRSIEMAESRADQVANDGASNNVTTTSNKSGQYNASKKESWFSRFKGREKQSSDVPKRETTWEAAKSSLSSRANKIKAAFSPEAPSNERGLKRSYTSIREKRKDAKKLRKETDELQNSLK